LSAATRVDLKAPYLVLVGDEDDETYAKTGLGLAQWRPERVAGQVRFPGSVVDLGVADLSVAEAVAAGIRTLVIGVAPVGGVIPDPWWEVIVEAADAGLDIACGLHQRLADNAAVVAAARASGARLIDIRVPPSGLPVATGRKRRGRRLLTVGTDCAVGKKYTALALEQAMLEVGMKATFRATGQTGIMIAGEGMPIDCVPADFIAGAAELLSPDNDEDHWDLIEGQGSLFHPGYAGVSLGLLHGSQPDAFVVCHDAAREAVSGWDDYPLPSIAECIEQTTVLGRRTNASIRCVGISLNTSGLTAPEKSSCIAELRTATALPCVDPLIDGCGAIVEYIQHGET
jgi:uncharacterized NAD-dependent epimerase/dehydratase family protein